MLQHAGKQAVVTGAGSGIGRAIAVRLAAEGAGVAVLDVDLDAANDTVRVIEENGGKAVAIACDVTNRSQVHEAVAGAASALGDLHYLVNNAGVVTMTGLADLTEEEWDFVVDVNLKGQFLVAQAIAPFIARSGGGAIVNLSTVEAEVVVSSSGHCQVHYNASKGGVPMLTKALAVELADQNIRVNAIAPGPINTRFTGGEITGPEAMAFMKQRLLIPRVGEPEDIAAAASFLLSANASYITGIQLPVDGGWLTR